jgi:hypothetical protein
MAITVPAPINLHSYLSSTDGIQVFYWSIDCTGLPAGLTLSQFKFQLCIDTVGSETIVPPFDGSTGNLRCFTDDDALTGFGIGQFGDDGFGIGGFEGGSRGFFNYRRGQLVFAYEIVMPMRQPNLETPYWWKVRIISPTLESVYSDPELVLRDQSLHREITASLFGKIPDDNAYTKDANSTNVYTLMKEFARQIELMRFEAKRTKNDIYIDKTRDENVYNNFGILYEYKKPTNVTPAEYKEQIRRIKEAFELAGTIGALNIFLQVFTCEEETLTLIRSLTGFRIFDATDFPLETKHWHIYDPVYESAFEGYGGNKPPIVIWSKKDKANGVLIEINNTLNFFYDADFIKEMIYKLIPTQVRVTFVV